MPPATAFSANHGACRSLGAPGTGFHAMQRSDIWPGRLQKSCPGKIFSPYPLNERCSPSSRLPTTSPPRNPSESRCHDGKTRGVLLFECCVRRLGLSEGSVARRIQVANVCRRFPQLLVSVTENRLSLTVAGMLAPHLREDNVEMVSCARESNRCHLT